MLSPCKDCTDRHVGCHGQCDKYSEFKNKLTEYNEKKRLEEVSKFSLAESILRHHKRKRIKEKEK